MKKRGRKPSGKHIWIEDLNASDPKDLERKVYRCKACGTLDTWELAGEACPMANQYIAQQQRIDMLNARQRAAAASRRDRQTRSATRAQQLRRKGHRH